MVMLVLNSRFALLAAFCSLATITFSSRWGVDAAAIQSRPFDHDHCHNVTSDQPSAQYILPLPLQSKNKQFKVRTHEWLYSNSVALLSDIMFSRLKRDDNTPGEACKFRKHGDYRFPAGMTRRSVLIPDNHGSEYVVSHSKRQVRRRRRRPKARRLNGIEEMPILRRAQDARVGYVAIMSPNYNSATGVEIAKLFAAPKSHEASILYASETNQTSFQLVDAPVSVESTSDLTPVTLEMGAPGETRTCATYNSGPPQDESDTDSENMTMEPCANRATPEASHKSQIFMYNGTSGTLEPTWNSADGAQANTTAASPSVNQNSTSSSNATATSSTVEAAATLFANRADTPQNPTKQNSTVSLVFTPIKATVTDVGIQENFNTTGTTMTKTRTVTVFDVESTSTRVPSSTSYSAAQVTATSSALDVQLVGAPIPSSNAAETSTTSSSTAIGLTDASAIASRIAASAASSASADDVSSTTINSSTGTSSASPTGSSTQAAQRRENKRLAASHVGTEPYTWMFKAEER